MGLRDILKKYGLDSEETSKRIDLLLSALRRKPGSTDALKAYGKQSGGGDSSDFIGPQLTAFVESAQNDPEQFRAILGSLFSLVFVVNRIEHLPAVGSILGASLDIMLMGGKMLTRAVQSSLPPMIGLIPLPYASSAGMVMSAVFGMIAWPIISLISLSRQDFAAATEAYTRAIPPPFGDILASTFTEGNRAVAKINEKREQLGTDLAAAFTSISGSLADSSGSTQEGLKALAEKTRAAAASGVERARAHASRAASSINEMIDENANTETADQRDQAYGATQARDWQKRMGMGGFHRRTKRKSWRTRRTRTRSARR